jgi:hypothetical protein
MKMTNMKKDRLTKMETNRIYVPALSQRKGFYDGA